MNENKPKTESLPKKDKKVVGSIMGLLNGSFFTRQGVIQKLPFVAFLAFVGVCYIANGYIAEDSVRKINNIGIELKELRSEFITTKSELMYRSKQSEIALALVSRQKDLKESSLPPRKLMVPLEQIPD